MIAQIDKKFVSKSLHKTYTRLLSYLFYEGRPLTVKGRFFNYVVFILYNLQSRLPAIKTVEKPIFILGTGRSGTTILGVTLGIHKDVGFLNEPKALWAFLNCKDDLIGSYLDEDGSYYLADQDVTSSMSQKAHNIYGNYLAFSFSNRIVDKYPEMIFRTSYLTKIFPDAKFLFLYRNGWDTCHSIKKWSERLGIQLENQTHDWWGLNNRKWRLLCEQVVANDAELSMHLPKIEKYTNHIHMAAVEWIVTMKQGIALRNNVNVMAVKYEDYVSSEKYRNNILQFCELEGHETYYDYCKGVLNSPYPKQPIILPDEISDEFRRLMEMLGYGG